MKNMKRRVIIHTSILVGLIMLLSFITYAWVSQTYPINQYIVGKSAASYFADGDGSESNPYIIDEPQHLFNLSYLNNAGFFSGYSFYFKIADRYTGEPITIDFTDPTLPEIFQTLEPIGDHNYPFEGIFIGNHSIVKGVIIDGDGKQDIGFFGFMHDGASATNFILEEPVINFNPSTSDDTTNFHMHNDGLYNRATGYIVGHLGMNTVLENIFVVAPTIQSLSNADANRSQYGLIGFNESDAGVLVGGPRGLFNFTIEGYSFYSKINEALNLYYNYYINGSGTLKLTDAFSYTYDSLTQIYTFTGINSGYSFSNLQISPSANDPSPVYLYDQMVIDQIPIYYNGKQYNRENIDMVGNFTITNINAGQQTADFYIPGGLVGVTTPALNSVFDPTNYPKAILFYVRVDDPDNLGQVTPYFSQGGKIFTYYSGFSVTTGSYLPSYLFGNKNSPQLLSVGSPGVTSDIQKEYAFAALKEDVNHDLIVVDPNTEDYDYFVYMLGIINGDVFVQQIELEFPPATLTDEALTKVSQLDFINDVTDLTYDSTTRDSWGNLTQILSWDSTSNKTLKFYDDGTYEFDDPTNFITEYGTWSWSSNTLTLTQEDLNVITATLSSGTFTISYVSVADPLVTESFTLADTTFEAAVGTSGSYTAFTYQSIDYSYFNFGYSLTEYQRLETIVVRAANGDFNLYIDFNITDISYFYIDVINTHYNNINIYIYDSGGTETPDYFLNSKDYYLLGTYATKVIEVELNYDDSVSVSAYG